MRIFLLLGWASLALAAEQPAVVLVHGWTCDKSFWDAQVPALAKSHRVVTLDLPGHGAAPLPRGGIRETTFADAVHAAIIKANAPTVVLVGHSMGGLVIRQYARLHPERVRALVFVDAVFGFPDTPEMRAWAEGFGGRNGPKARADMVSSVIGPHASAALRSRIRTAMLAAPEATAVEAARWMVNPKSAPPGDEFWIPALVIYAAATPAPVKLLNSIFRNHQSVPMQGAGHFLMMEKPDEFNRILLRFLGNVADSPTPSATQEIRFEPRR